MSWPDRLGLWWGTVEGADLESLIAGAATAGFTDISVSPAMYLAARARGRSDQELRDRLSDHGVRVAMVDPLIAGLPGAPDPSAVGARWRSTFEHGEADCLRVAHALGAEAVNVAHFLGAPTPLDELSDAIGAVAHRFHAHEVGTLVEFMPEGSIRTLADAAAICTDIAAEDCRITVDTWHLWRGGNDAADLAGVPGGLIGALQVSDATRRVRSSWTKPPERDRLLPGTGHMNLREMIAAASHSTTQPIIGVEIFRSAWAGWDVTDVARLAYSSCESLFDEAQTEIAPGQ